MVFKKIKNRTVNESLSAKPAQSDFIFLSLIIEGVSSGSLAYLALINSLER